MLDGRKGAFTKKASIKVAYKQAFRSPQQSPPCVRGKKPKPCFQLCITVRQKSKLACSLVPLNQTPPYQRDVNRGASPFLMLSMAPIA